MTVPSSCKGGGTVVFLQAMLTLQVLRNDRDALAQALAKRGIDAAPLLDRILALDEDRRHTQKEVDDLKAQAERGEPRDRRALQVRQERTRPKPRRAGMVSALKEKIHVVGRAPEIASSNSRRRRCSNCPTARTKACPAGHSPTPTTKWSQKKATKPQLHGEMAHVPHWELADRYKL